MRYRIPGEFVALEFDRVAAIFEKEGRMIVLMESGDKLTLPILPESQKQKLLEAFVGNSQ